MQLKSDIQNPYARLIRYHPRKQDLRCQWSERVCIKKSVTECKLKPAMGVIAVHRCTSWRGCSLPSLPNWARQIFRTTAKFFGQPPVTKV